MSRSLTVIGFLLALLLTASAAVSAQVEPARPDSARRHAAASIPRLVAGGLIGGAVGALPPLMFLQGCGPEAEECLADVARGLAVGAGYLVGVPVGVYLAGGRRTRVLRPLLGSLWMSGIVGLIALGTDPSVAYAIPVVYLVVNVSEAR